MKRLGQSRTVPVTVADDLSLSDLKAALAAGWKDYLANPLFGLFFGGIYVAAGMTVYFVLFAQGEAAWLIPAVTSSSMSKMTPAPTSTKAP